MDLDIQSRMKEKLEPLLTQVPGKFAYHPKVIDGLESVAPLSQTTNSLSGFCDRTSGC